MNAMIKDTLILFAITLIAGGLLGATYSITKEPIAIQNEIQNNIALSNVINDASFSEIAIVENEAYDSIQTINEAKQGDELVGYVFKVVTNEGYGGEISLVVGIDMDGKLKGIDIISHSETPGLGSESDEDGFKNQFIEQKAMPLTVDKVASGDGIITAISGATITSKAVTGAVNDAIDYYNN
jgi:electron transport complex protein RnfG